MMAQRIGEFIYKLAETMVCICGTYRNCSCHSAWSDIYYPAKDYLW